MKKLGILWMLMIAIFATAQTATLSLSVFDAKNNAISSANIEAYNAKNQLITTATTLENGTATLNAIPLEKIKLIVSQNSFEDYVKDFTIKEITQDLGKITLKSIANKAQLQDVTVRAESSVYRTELGKRVVDVGKDLISVGANAADILNNIPSLSVDGQSGELTLRGNENVRVFVDGKPSTIPTAQLLKQLPSNSISKIEIITNASAKYEPDGNSGIVNIVTVKSKRIGYNGGVDLGFTQGRRKRYNAAFNGNFNTGKVNFFGNYGANFGENEFLGEVINYSTEFFQNFKLVNDNQSQNFKAGMDWFINDKTALTFYTSQNFGYSPSLNEFTIAEFATPSVVQNNFTDSSTKNHNQDYAANFKKDFSKPEHSIEIDATYSIGNSDAKALLDNETPIDNSFYQITEANSNNTRINIDYENKIEKFGKIESGLQYRNEKLENTFLTDEIYLSNEVSDRSFDWTRNIFSAYTNYNNKWKKFGAQIGLRAESVTEDADFVQFNSTTNELKKYKNDYIELYPSAFLTYDYSDKITFSLNYSRRIDRPSPNQISPIREWNTPLITSLGNPDLQPQFTNSFELGTQYKFKNGSLNGNLIYRKINDQIFRSLSVDPADSIRTLMQFTNYDTTQGFGLELSSNYRPYKFWNINASFDIFSNEIQDSNYDVIRSNPWNARISQNFKINNSFSVQHFFMYRGEFEFVQGTMQPMWRMDLGARYSFMDGKASFTARVSDIFKTFYANANIRNPFLSEGTFRWEAQTLYVGFSYNFGGKVKSRNEVHNKSDNAGNVGGGIGF